MIRSRGSYLTPHKSPQPLNQGSVFFLDGFLLPFPCCEIVGEEFHSDSFTL